MQFETTSGTLVEFEPKNGPSKVKLEIPVYNWSFLLYDILDNLQISLTHKICLLGLPQQKVGSHENSPETLGRREYKLNKSTH